MDKRTLNEEDYNSIMKMLKSSDDENVIIGLTIIRDCDLAQSRFWVWLALHQTYRDLSNHLNHKIVNKYNYIYSKIALHETYTGGTSPVHIAVDGYKKSSTWYDSNIMDKYLKPLLINVLKEHCSKIPMVNSLNITLHFPFSNIIGKTINY
jgi:hypothetical protein